MESPTDGLQYRYNKCFVHHATRLEEELKFHIRNLRNCLLKIEIVHVTSRRPCWCPQL